MKQDINDKFTDNLPAYVLGALGPAEASALEMHLKTCTVCQAEIKEYRQVGEGLLAAFPLKAPSLASKQKLIARLGRQNVLNRSNNRWRFGRFAVAMTMLALVVGSIYSLLQIQDLQQQQTKLAGQIGKNNTILGLLTADTEIHSVTSNTFSGNLLLDREKNLSYLLIWNLPRPSADQVYQIWLVGADGERVDAGTFVPEQDLPLTSTALVTMRNFNEFVGIEVTVEPSGGSDNPTGEQILNASY